MIPLASSIGWSSSPMHEDHLKRRVDAIAAARVDVIPSAAPEQRPEGATGSGGGPAQRCVKVSRITECVKVSTPSSLVRY